MAYESYETLKNLIFQYREKIDLKICSADYAKGYCKAAIGFSKYITLDEYDKLSILIDEYLSNKDLCKVSCFDRVMYLIKPLPEDKLKEAYEITCEDSFIDFLDFCVENHCFTESQSTTLYEGIIMWEDLEGNYYEEDHNKLNQLYDKVGLTKEICQQFSEEIEREE